MQGELATSPRRKVSNSETKSCDMFYAPVAQTKHCPCVRSGLLGRSERSSLMERSVDSASTLAFKFWGHLLSGLGNIPLKDKIRVRSPVTLPS